jgi:hypothetical protein
MHSRSALLPVLTYLFRRLEKRFDGSPTLMILDEAWLYLTESLFAAKIREWLRPSGLVGSVPREAALHNLRFLRVGSWQFSYGEL